LVLHRTLRTWPTLLWRRVLETMRRPVFRYTWIAAIFQIVFIELARYWFLATPPPGYAIAALALAAVIMAVRGPRFTRAEEVIWICIACALFVVEIRAIANDRTRFAKDEAQARTDENASFQRIVSQLTESNERDQKRFAITTKELSVNLNTLTGGESSCYLAGVSLATPSYLVFVHIGKFPLYGVVARIVPLSQDGKTVRPGSSLLGITVTIGDMIKGHASIIQSLPKGLITSQDFFNANIFFTARNGDWEETLREKRIGEDVRTALRVTGRFTTLQREQNICERIDPQFPKKPNGDIDDGFQAVPKVDHCP